MGARMGEGKTETETTGREGWWADLQRSGRLVWSAGPATCVALLGLALLGGILPTAMVWTGKLILDAVVAHDGAAAVRALGIEAALAAVAALSSAAGGLMQGILRQQLGHQVNRAILDKTLTLDLAHFENADFYDRLTRARREASVRPLSMVRRLMSFVQLGLSLLGAAGLLLRFSWVAALVLLLATLPAWWHQTRYAREGFRLFNWRAPETREQAYYEAVLTREEHAKEIMLFGLGRWFLDRYQAIHDRLFREDRALAVRREAVGAAVTLAGITVFYGIYAWIAWSAVQGWIGVGDLSLYLMAFRQGQQTLSGLVQAASGIVEDRLYLSNLTAFLDAPVPRQEGGAIHGPDPADGLRFEGVSFSYPGAARPAVEGVDLHLPPGRVLALVGENGSGKTTIIKLMTGLYTPTGGRVLLDGLPLEDWDRSVLRRRIGAVLQDFSRYQLTAADNIRLGDLQAEGSMAQVDAAADRGLASEVIGALPQGMQTRLGQWFKGGVELSGGQWQRMALSRAFMRTEADLLVLDEPTAAMDAAAEAGMFLRLKEMAVGRMAVLISHRFSTVRLADHIVVLDHGRVIERGSHEELLASDGTYANLFRLQAEAYR